MCIICKEWELGKLTSKEALRNLGEMILSSNDNKENPDHYYEISEKILDKEVPMMDTEEEMDDWQEEDND